MDKHFRAYTQTLRGESQRLRALESRASALHIAGLINANELEHAKTRLRSARTSLDSVIEVLLSNRDATVETLKPLAVAIKKDAQA